MLQAPYVAEVGVRPNCVDSDVLSTCELFQSVQTREFGVTSVGWNGIYRADWHSGNSLDSYLEGARFESRLQLRYPDFTRF
jgi:hypothetical protein